MSDTLNVREFLRSKGFTVGERGRFSAEMLAAVQAEHPSLIGADGKLVKAAAPAKAGDASPKAPRAKRPLPKPAEPQRVVRSPGNTKFIATSGNIRLVYDTCFDCKTSTKFCGHDTPVPPRGFVALDGHAGLV